MKREVMHRENRAILWLQRDFGIHLCDLLDTGQASRVLKLERNNLEHILQHYFRVTVGYLDGAFDVESLVENLLGQPVGNQGCCGGLHFCVTLMLNLNTMWIQASCNVVAPSPHESHTTTFVGEDKVVIFGGSGEGETVSLNDFHVLDHRTMRWTSPTMRVHIPIPKDSDSAIAIGNKLVVYGWDCGDQYHRDVDVFDRDNSIWSRLTVQGSLLSVGASHVAVSIVIKVFIVGRTRDKHYYNNIWVVNVSACCWVQLDICGQYPQYRFSHTVVFTKSKISIYKGYGEGEHRIKYLLVLQLGAQYPNRRYNMCTIFGSHRTQKERRFLRVAENNLRIMYLGDNEVSKQEAHEAEP
ncbi:hypothetical protein Gotri_018822 [Gossypium trilobum]|uniref:Uncharacterized protein n=1 Tax=Gossypium trilobum TaxID=34281 RepID=A0A7J9EAW4_9ROSI|nr:hypothetical protein [Gossypium trilobum]